MEEAGFELDTIIQSVIVKEMNADDINIILGKMDINRYDNPYVDKLYDMVDTIRY